MADHESNERKRTLSPFNLLVLLLLLISLLLNAYVISQLLQLRRVAQAAVSESVLLVGGLRNETLALTIPIDQTIVLDTELPVSQTLSVPIQTDIPISTTVRATVDAGFLGDIPVTVPIQTTVPVDLVVDVPFETTFPIRVPVDVQMDVPVSIAIADTALYDSLGHTEEVLEAVSTQLGP